MNAKAGMPACRLTTDRMLLFVFVVTAVCVITSAKRVARGLIPASLGSMSAKWVAEHRGSHEA
jgi:hypothetical protein